ncbi:MAG: hypothetical protein ACOH1N_12800 [Lutibacter sp.]
MIKSSKLFSGNSSFILSRIEIEQRQKVNTTFFGGFYCGELEAVLSVGERNEILLEMMQFKVHNMSQLRLNIYIMMQLMQL